MRFFFLEEPKRQEQGHNQKLWGGYKLGHLVIDLEASVFVICVCTFSLEDKDHVIRAYSTQQRGTRWINRSTAQRLFTQT